MVQVSYVVAIYQKGHWLLWEYSMVLQHPHKAANILDVTHELVAVWVYFVAFYQKGHYGSIIGRLQKEIE